MKWIFNPIIDLSFMIIGPLIFAMSYYSSITPAFLVAPIYFIALVMLDSGHVYLTYIRLFKEWKLIKTTAILLHLGIFIFFLAMMYFKINYLWHFVVYATFFHFIRQFYGVMRWYLFLDKNNHSYILDILFYLTTLTPFICLHFREDIPAIGYYAKVDTFHYASAELFNFFKYFNLAALGAWIAYEINFYLKFRQVELSRILYLSTTIILFNLVGFYAKGASMIILPLVAAHGLQYYILLGEMVNKVHFFNMAKTITIVILTGLILGYLNGWGEEEADLTYIYRFRFQLWNASMVALLLTPLFAHYILDMVIWKRSFMQRVSCKTF